MLALVADNVGAKTIEVKAAARTRWGVNLADPQYGILQDGKVVNVGGDLSCDGACQASVAIWNDANYSKALSFIYPLDTFICKE